MDPETVETVDPETQRLINLLKVSLRILGISNREVARRLQMSPSYLSKLLSGASEIRLNHVVRICRAVGLEPMEFFALAYPVPPARPGPSAGRLREMLQSVSPPTKSAEQLRDEQRMQEMLKVMLERLAGAGGTGGE